MRGAANIGDKERLASSVAGACLLASGLLSSRRGSLLTSLLGGALLHRGMTGRCQTYAALGISTAETHPGTVIHAQSGEKVEQSVSILRTPAELYSFWRELENLPKVMKHLTSVEAIDRERSHWVAVGPLGKPVEWNAEIFNDVENELIAWRSLPDSTIDTAGSVRFTPLPHAAGTKVTVSLKYLPPGGKVGAAIAALTGHGLDKIVHEDLHRFKQLMEAGEIASSDHQPSGRAAGGP